MWSIHIPNQTSRPGVILIRLCGIVEWKWTQCEWWSSLLLPNQRGIVAQFRMANKYSRNCQNLSDISDLRNHSLTTLGHLICIRHSRLPENWKCQTFEWRWRILWIFPWNEEEDEEVNKWPFRLGLILKQMFSYFIPVLRKKSYGSVTARLKQ